MRHVNVPSFSEPLSADGKWAAAGEAVTASAGALTDHFAPPTGEGGRANSATLLTAAPEGDFVFSARVHVDAQADFDAGTLLIYFDDAHWAKLCCEAMPGLQPAIVSVITRGRSDDAGGFFLDANSAYLRVSRISGAFAFHGSPDGSTWTFIRFFHLESGNGPPQIGFTAQSPTGPGCEVRFSEISFEQRTLAELRDGS